MSLKDEQIAVIVDGDDSLAHNKVLQRLEEEYMIRTFGSPMASLSSIQAEMGYNV